MSKITRSARGSVVDFDLLAIKQQIASAQVPTSVEKRRQFIDEKDGVKTKTFQEIEQETPIHEALIPPEEGSRRSKK